MHFHRPLNFVMVYQEVHDGTIRIEADVDKNETLRRCSRQLDWAPLNAIDILLPYEKGKDSRTLRFKNSGSICRPWVDFWDSLYHIAMEQTPKSTWETTTPASLYACAFEGCDTSFYTNTAAPSDTIIKCYKEAGPHRVYARAVTRLPENTYNRHTYREILTQASNDVNR